jgi:hypothetical protein
MAAFADKIYEAVTEQLGSPVPRFAGNSILLTLRVRDEERPRIERLQRYESRALYQEILIINPGQADQEHLLEALTWCLLNRYAMTRQALIRREVEPVECPEWLSMGLAQTLFPLSKNRNRRLLTRSFSRQPLHSVEEILAWTRLPDHRPVTHAQCELQFQWLVYENADFLFVCLERLSAERGLGANWVKEQCGLWSDRQFMMRRDVWVAKEVLPHVALRAYQAEDIRKLQSLLNLELPLFDLFYEYSAQETRSLFDLIQTLPTVQSRETLFLLERELNRLNAGKSGPLHAWSNAFTDFLYEVRSEEDAPAHLRRHVKRLQQFEQERRELMGEWLNQDRYLDTFEMGE